MLKFIHPTHSVDIYADHDFISCFQVCNYTSIQSQSSFAVKGIYQQGSNKSKTIDFA